MALFAPASVGAAVDLLAGPNAGLVVAGATSLMLERRRPRPGTVVALQSIDELKDLAVGDRELRIGAMVTLQRLVDDARLQVLEPGLWQALAAVGTVRIRNMATIGGALASGAPDPWTALTGLDATVEIAGPRGRTMVGVRALDASNGTAVPQGCIITAVLVQHDPDRRSAYRRSVPRSAPDRPLTTAFVAASLDADGYAHDVRVCASATGRPAVRYADLEHVLVGTRMGPNARTEVGAAYAKRMNPADTSRASGWYQAAMVAADIASGLAGLGRAETLG